MAELPTAAAAAVVGALHFSSAAAVGDDEEEEEDDDAEVDEDEEDAAAAEAFAQTLVTLVAAAAAEVVEEAAAAAKLSASYRLSMRLTTGWSHGSASTAATFGRFSGFLLKSRSTRPRSLDEKCAPAGKGLCAAETMRVATTPMLEPVKGRASAQSS